jgi:Tripartite tricarboxylate transporter family receptor
MRGLGRPFHPGGGGPALTDLLGGQVQVMFFTSVASIEYIRAGRLRALAVTAATRSDELPDIPTVAEFVPGYEASNWFGVCAPKAPRSSTRRSTLALPIQRSRRALSMWVVRRCRAAPAIAQDTKQIMPCRQLDDAGRTDGGFRRRRPWRTAWLVGPAADLGVARASRRGLIAKH